MAIAKQGGARWDAFLVDDRTAPGVGGFAGGEQIVLAEEATAAGDHKGDHHAVANLQISHAFADVLDDAHELVAENVAGFRLRILP